MFRMHQCLRHTVTGLVPFKHNNWTIYTKKYRMLFLGSNIQNELFIHYAVLCTCDYREILS